MNHIFRKILGPFKPLAKKIFPGYFKYDTVNYWVKREGPTYYDNYSRNFDNTLQAKLQEKTLLNNFRELGFDTILEYGCGYARILKLVENEFKGKTIEGCDVSPHQLRNSEHLLGKDTNCKLFLVNGRTIPKDDNSYDIVYLCNVLQHQTHQIINNVRSEILRIAKKYIVLMEPTYTPEEEESDRKEGTVIDKTCYKHDHTGYFISKGCKILKYEWIEKVGNYNIIIERPEF